MLLIDLVHIGWILVGGGSGMEPEIGTTDSAEVFGEREDARSGDVETWVMDSGIVFGEEEEGKTDWVGGRDGRTWG
jgi:hypothetical protein